MLADTFFQFKEAYALRRNSLCDMLQLNEANENDIQPIIHSPYYDMDMLKLLSEQTNGWLKCRSHQCQNE